MEDKYLDETAYAEDPNDLLRDNDEDDVRRLMEKCDNCREFRPKREIRANGGLCNLCHSDEDLAETRKSFY